MLPVADRWLEIRKLGGVEICQPPSRLGRAHPIEPVDASLSNVREIL